jgi:uncharacterized repeat protein (TIGR03803 family)
MKRMKPGERLGSLGWMVGMAIVAAVGAPGMASAQTLTTLVSFQDGGGMFPGSSTLIADADGNLFGTTIAGGAFGNGTVFEIAKTTSGYAGTAATLVSFNVASGSNPQSGVIADANGNLFGTALTGGAYECGTLFEVTKTSGGYASTPTTLVSFDCADGASPLGRLVFDANGNLLGTTAEGGASGNGTVFEVARTADGYSSTPTTLYSFNGSDGEAPEGGLMADANGNLFGTTALGGVSQDGTVFEVAKTSIGYASPTILISFNGAQGANPHAFLIADADGNLFGTTEQGGAYGYGTVFEIARTSSGYASAPTTLVSFNNADGSYLYGGLIIDAAGNLFGTTDDEGPAGRGTVFKIAKTSSGYAGAPDTLASFNYAFGANPDGA